jgi:lipoprotein-anchoring transpeptidase ErfK/SrfK
MLAQPGSRRSSPSKLPAALVVLAALASGVYFQFFRPRPAAAPTAAAPAPAPAKDLAVFEKAFSEPVAAPAPVPAPRSAAVNAPRTEPGKAAGSVAPVKFETPVPAPAPVPAALPVPAAVAPAAPPPPPAPVGPRAEVDALVAEGKWREARAKVASVFGGALSDADRSDLSSAGIRVNQELLQNQADPKEVELYEIQQGDTLEAIAKKFKTLNGVKGSLMYVNNYPENAILRAGRKVRIPRGTWSILVDKSQFMMYVLYEGCPFKSYKITTGAPHKETPVTRFVVGNKNPKPAWWPPADTGVKGPVPYGDPRNPLGEWWISLEHDLHHGIGIHGTNDPGSIGTKASNGCVRMVNKEVVEVAALAYKGMVVAVVD